MSTYSRPVETQKQSPTLTQKDDPITGFRCDTKSETLQGNSISLPARDRSAVSIRRQWIANHEMYYWTCKMKVREKYHQTIKSILAD